MEAEREAAAVSVSVAGLKSGNNDIVNVSDSHFPAVPPETVSAAPFCPVQAPLVRSKNTDVGSKVSVYEIAVASADLSPPRTMAQVTSAIRVFTRDSWMIAMTRWGRGPFLFDL